MGKIVCDTGTKVLTISLIDRLILILLVTFGIESVLFYSDWWFFGGHRKNIFLFIILSYAVFRGVFRSVATWIFFLFISIPKKTRCLEGLSVDVLTTAMPGEPYEMFESTLTAIANIKYPHTSYLLDGGDDGKLKALCARLGIVHINCKGIGGAKAGKVNYCLRNSAKGEFVLIIDPDHIPESDFLHRVLPYFEKPRIGFVQVVQAYYNLNNTFVSKAAAEQTFGFYGPLMMSLHGLSMPLAIGANCVFRRKALDSIGGHAESLAEDANTSLRLHAKGWQSAYVPYRASYGLVPEDLTTFFKQQLKWSTGMFKLFFDEYFKSIKNLSWAGKIYYFFAGTFYLNGPVALLTFALPVIFLFCKIFAVEMSFSDFLVHLMPYLLVSVTINFFTQKWFSDNSERGFPWRSMFLEKGSWYIYLLGFIYAVSGKKVLYLPTPKNAARDACVKLVLPNIIVVILSLAAVIFVFCTYLRIDGGTILMSAFAIVNVLSLLPVIYTGIKPLVIKIPEVEMEFSRPKEAISFTGQTKLQTDIPSRTELAAERNRI